MSVGPLTNDWEGAFYWLAGTLHDLLLFRCLEGFGQCVTVDREFMTQYCYGMIWAKSHLLDLIATNFVLEVNQCTKCMGCLAVVCKYPLRSESALGSR